MTTPIKTSSINTPAPVPARNLLAAIALYSQIEAHATELATERGELLETKAQAEAEGRPFYMGDRLNWLNEVIADDEQQELLVTAAAYGYIAPVFGQA